MLQVRVNKFVGEISKHSTPGDKEKKPEEFGEDISVSNNLKKKKYIQQSNMQLFEYIPSTEKSHSYTQPSLTKTLQAYQAKI